MLQNADRWGENSLLRRFAPVVCVLLRLYAILHLRSSRLVNTTAEIAIAPRMLVMPLPKPPAAGSSAPVWFMTLIVHTPGSAGDGKTPCQAT